MGEGGDGRKPRVYWFVDVSMMTLIKIVSVGVVWV